MGGVYTQEPLCTVVHMGQADHEGPACGLGQGTLVAWARARAFCAMVPFSLCTYFIELIVK